VWLGDSLDRLQSFPADVRQRIGFALYQAQIGDKHESAKPLHGFDGPVWQIRADDSSGTYRAVYVLQRRSAIYVLHAFQKKARAGITTSQRDIEMIRQRLKLASRVAGKKGD